MEFYSNHLQPVLNFAKSKVIVNLEKPPHDGQHDANRYSHFILYYLYLEVSLDACSEYIFPNFSIFSRSLEIGELGDFIGKLYE